MGMVNYECIVATTWSDDAMKEFILWMYNVSSNRNLFAIINSELENTSTIILAPDGSKKGWPEANVGAAARDDFIKFLKSCDYEDGSSPFSWVEVGYGEFGQKVLRGNNTNKYDDRDYCYNLGD